MMKRLILLTLLFSPTVFAQTVEEAQNFYAQRDLDAQGLENARKAADTYKAILENQNLSLDQRADILSRQSEALYFVGLVLQRDGDKEEAKKVFWEGFEVALNAVNMLGDKPGDKRDPVNAKIASNGKLLAYSMYWELVNILRWGKLYGVLQALSKWKEIGEPRIIDILRLDFKTMNYGVHRSAGKALITLPGNPKIEGRDALSFLEEAYHAGKTTVGDITLSNNMATVTFYLDALRDAKKKEEFCPIYKNLQTFMRDADDTSLNQMFPGLVPEAKFEYEDFLNNDDIAKFAKRSCR